ncbi:autotransporter assembly complex protein TamA [Thioalkalivibrio sulfidiphilus]|uniref:autotransporter assembly complex protein TamA n=1 Tax=Thioalkalivibrio sulfidiphilus TaxID=1033854 RepID=UPI000373E061|nr:autotransporter assembly complex family protein [Thioalkalivibrio sulfidiphilus]
MRTVRRLAAAVMLLACLPLGTAQAQSPRLNITGVGSELEDNIRVHLSIAREDCELPAWRERPLLRRANDESREALRALGYYRPELEMDFRRTEDCWTLEVRVQPGEPVRVRAVEVTLDGEAGDDPAFRTLLADAPMKPGDVLRHDRYEQLRNSLTRLAADRGYLDNRIITRELRVHAGEGVADAVIHMDSGVRYRFGIITIEQDILKPEFVDKFLPFEEGEPYDSVRLIDLQQALVDGNYFSDVRVRTETEARADGAVPIRVELTPRPRHAYLAGIGASTDIGPRLRLGYEHRYANRSGHRYNADMEFSPVRSGVGFNYEIPLQEPARERLNLMARYQTEDTDTVRSDLYGLGVSHTRQHDSGWLETRSLVYEREDYTVAGITDRSDLLMPGLSFSRVRADHPVFPRRGWRLYGGVRGAHEDLGSSVSFAQVHGRAKLITPFGPGRLITRGEGGATQADLVTELPSSVRFFAGGDNSVRGYGYQRLGPTNADGEVIGGRHLLTGSVEYEIPLFGKWSAAAFVDSGNAYDRIDDFDPKTGVGLGIRWRSPIGPIRVDIAHPVDGDENFRLHLTMGADL